MSPEVQKRCISGPKERTYVFQKLKKNNAECHTLDLKGRRKSYNCFGSVTHLTVVKLSKARNLPPPPFLPQSSSFSQRLQLVGLLIVHKECLISKYFQII